MFMFYFIKIYTRLRLKTVKLNFLDSFLRLKSVKLIFSIVLNSTVFFAFAKMTLVSKGGLTYLKCTLPLVEYLGLDDAKGYTSLHGQDGFVVLARMFRWRNEVFGSACTDY